MAGLLSQLHQAAQKRIEDDSKKAEVKGAFSSATLGRPPAADSSAIQTGSVVEPPVQDANRKEEPARKPLPGILGRFKQQGSATSQSDAPAAPSTQPTTPTPARSVLLQDDVVTPESLSPAGGSVASPVDLANMDTDSIQAKNLPGSAEDRQIDSIKQELLLTGPEQIRKTLDEVDDLMQKDIGITGIALGVIRNKMAQVMTSLRDNPEWDSILLDKDVHNTIRFLRGVKGEAQLEQEVKTKKAAIKSSKTSGVKSLKGKTFDFSTIDLKAMAEKHLKIGK